jgi:hypothetical protein
MRIEREKLEEEIGGAVLKSVLESFYDVLAVLCLIVQFFTFHHQALHSILYCLLENIKCLRIKKVKLPLIGNG